MQSHFLKAFICFSFLFLNILNSNVYAALEDKIDDDKPVTFQADNVFYDDVNKILTAKGNVEVVQEDNILLTDTLRYYEQTEIIVAEGNVVIVDKSGNIGFVDRFDLTGDLKEGVAQEIKFILSDKSKLAARGIRRIFPGDKAELYKGVYSPCKVCDKPGKRTPLWQLKAGKVIKNDQSQQIIYHDVVGEFFGLPILYSPYFQHPSPDAPRKSGFLIPMIRATENLGTVVNVPYYIVLDRDKDLVLNPWYTTKHGPLMEATYAQNLGFGRVSMNGSIVRADRKDLVFDVVNGRRKRREVLRKNKIRGHINAEGSFSFDENWRGGFEAFFHSDDTYRRLFGFGTKTIFKNQAYIEGFFDKSYVSAQALIFDNVRAIVADDRDPAVLPLIQAQYVSNPDLLNGIWSFDTSFRSVLRKDVEGPTSYRWTSKLKWVKPYISPQGVAVTFSASSSQYAYFFRDFIRPDLLPNGVSASTILGLSQADLNARFPLIANTQDDSEVYIWPTAQLDVRYPWIAHYDGAQIVFEPVAGVVVANNTRDRNQEVPDEDSRGFELDETNIFEDHRLPGLDREEPGSRVYYGFNADAIFSGTEYIKVFVGQSYNLGDKITFKTPGRQEDRVSDVITRLIFKPHKYVDFVGRASIDPHDGDLSKAEFVASLGPSFLKADITYSFVDADILSVAVDDPEEITLAVEAEIDDYWTVGAATKKDIDRGFSPSHSIKAGYRDECFGLDVNYTRVNTQDRDIDPEHRFMVTLWLKNLGSFSYQQDFDKILDQRLELRQRRIAARNRGQ